jgi:hypothetical protein
MKRETTLDLGVFAGLVVFGVLTRLLSAEFPQALSNFTAVGAVALFAGYYFRDSRIATLVPLALMVVSNLVLKQYNSLGQMAIVYFALILPVILGFALRGRENVLRIGGCAITTSVWFFVITNFAYWAWYDLYPKTASGLIQGYVMALPFFRNMVAGDLLFSGVLFGAYAIAVQVGMIPRRSATAVASASA